MGLRGRSLALVWIVAMRVVAQQVKHDNTDVLIWKPADSMVVNCAWIAYGGPDTLLCMSIERDSLYWVDMRSRAVFRRVELPENVQEATIVRVATAARISPGGLFVLTDFRKLLLISSQGEVLCDFSPWMEQKAMEIYGSGNVLWPVGDTTFVALVDLECAACIRSDSVVGLFGLDTVQCGLRLHRFLFKSVVHQEIGKKYMTGWSPELAAYGDSLLLLSYRLLDTLYEYSLFPVRMKGRIPIRSHFYRSPSPFDYGQGFRTYGEYRKALTRYFYQNAWIGPPVWIDRQTRGVIILPATLPEFSAWGVRPMVVWLSLADTASIDVVMQTFYPPTRFIGTGKGYLYVVAQAGPERQVLYKFVMDTLMEFVSREEGMKVLQAPIKRMVTSARHKADSFIYRLVREGRAVGILWLPTGCTSDVAFLPDDTQVYRKLIVLTASDGLKNLLPEGVKTLTPPYPVGRLLRASFPALTLFRVQDGQIVDTLTEVEITQFLSQEQKETKHH